MAPCSVKARGYAVECLKRANRSQFVTSSTFSSSVSRKAKSGSCRRIGTGNIPQKWRESAAGRTRKQLRVSGPNGVTSRYFDDELLSDGVNKFRQLFEGGVGSLGIFPSLVGLVSDMKAFRHLFLTQTEFVPDFSDH